MSPSRTLESRNRERAVFAGSVLLYGIFALLLFGPLAFGAVEPWSILVLELGSGALFLVWIFKQALEGDLTIKWNPVFPPMAAFGLLVAAQLVFHLSAYPHDTAFNALLYCSYAVLCFLASQTLIRSSQVRTLTIIFSVYGAVLACFALIQGISSNGKLYWLRQPRAGGWIYGPYVNHNHYAGLMEMLFPILLILSLTRLASTKTRYAAAAAAAVMAGTIFLSGSRGGMLAVTVETIILASILVRQKRGVRAAFVIAIFLAVIVALLVWLGGPELAKRLASAGPGHSEIPRDVRSYINHDGLRMFLKKPILGWGLGAFPVIYPQFRTFYTNFFVNEAHNDYLQLLVETGLLGFGVMIWLVLTIYLRAVKKIGHWTSDAGGAVALACLLGVSGILVHSAVDFNLQIPANAALFYVFCTLAAAPPFLQPARRRRTVRSKPSDEVTAPQEALTQSATNF